MRRFAPAFGLAVLAGCASAPPPASAPTAPAPATVACVRGTLGIEAGPLSRSLRKRLALGEETRGAVVLEVFASGPAGPAGIRKDDVVVEVGGRPIGNDCDFDAVAYGRSCDRVTVVVLRAGARVEATITPADEDRLFESACRAGVPAGCYRKAWGLVSPTSSDADRTRALDLLAGACRAGSAEACAYGGQELAKRPERAGDASAMLRRACDLGSGAGCAHLAFQHATGKAPDDAIATPLYVRACELGDALGCYNVGLMEEAGRAVKGDIRRAAAAYREACDGGSSTACTNLGWLYERGRGVAKDEARAVELYRRGCDGTRCQGPNLAGCVNLGRAHRDGLGGPKDPARAAAVFEKVCDGEADPRDLDPEEHRSRACSLLGALVLNGTGVPKDLKRGRELSELGCARGDSFGCFNAATLYSSGTGVAADDARAASFYEKACAKGDSEACYELGKQVEAGLGVKKDARRARELLKTACEGGFEKACAKGKK